MIEHGSFKQIAKTNAEAIRGLWPKIDIRNTEGGSNPNGPESVTMTEVAGGLQHAATTLEDHAGADQDVVTLMDTDVKQVELAGN